jgi:hypothetical protein
VLLGLENLTRSCYSELNLLPRREGEKIEGYRFTYKGKKGEANG